MKTDSKKKIILATKVIGCFLAMCVIYGAFISIKRLMKEDALLTESLKQETAVTALSLKKQNSNTTIIEEQPKVAERKIVYDNMTIEELSQKLNRSLNSTLTGKGYSFAKACLELGVDPYLAVAIVLEETGCKWNCSSLVKQCNNVGGQKGGTVKCNGGSYRYYPTLEEGIYGFVENLARNYYAKGLTTPEQMNSKYAASTSWATKVNRYIEKIKAS